jgi:hypothetical protein
MERRKEKGGASGSRGKVVSGFERSGNPDTEVKVQKVFGGWRG